jgi:uncharacterized protein GlcG (DUF336 family)
MIAAEQCREKSVQMRPGKLMLLIASLLAFHAATAQEKLKIRKELPLTVAIEAAQTAIDACAAKRVTVHVFVLDADANVRLMLIPDGARYDTTYGALHKGYTAVKTGVPTLELMKKRGENPSSLPKDPKMVFLGGAVPIKVGSRVIGALSAGGGAPEQDAACAQAGLDKIQHYLQ